MAFVYNNGGKLLGDNTGRINWLADATIKAILVTSGYIADRDDVFVSTIGANELSGIGYVSGFNGSGRKALASKTLAVDNVNNRSTYGAANPSTYTAINAGTAHAVVIIKEVTSDADSLLIAYLDLVSDQPTSGGDLNINFPGGFCFALTN